MLLGAFGLFGPSQFRNLYRHVTRPAARGQMHFVGETFSTTHGYV
jgi:monoamine oxidase